jgi:hypothetical protein
MCTARVGRYVIRVDGRSPFKPLSGKRQGLQRKRDPLEGFGYPLREVIAGKRADDPLLRIEKVGAGAVSFSRERRLFCDA